MPYRQEYGDRLDRRFGSACPKCGSMQAHRTHRRSLMDFMLSLSGVWPFRCRSCKTTYRAMRILRRLAEERPWAMPPAVWRVPEQE